MTFPGFASRSWPSDPTMPSAPPDGYVAPVIPPNPSTSEPPMTAAQVASRRSQFYELILRQVLLALANLFVPGNSSFSQLQDWANTLAAIPIDMSAVTGLLTGLTNLFPVAFPNGNGTATVTPLAASTITVNGDGTATYVRDSLTQLFF